jgi:hypothetical protein
MFKNKGSGLWYLFLDCTDLRIRDLEPTRYPKDGILELSVKRNLSLVRFVFDARSEILGNLLFR